MVLVAKPSPRAIRVAKPQTFLRQSNTLSNVEFYYTNRGILFSQGGVSDEGLFWPRGSGNSYVFAQGLWFGAKKRVGDTLRKLCDLGYNPDTGIGWFMEGEAKEFGKDPGSDGAMPSSKYISYVGTRYDTNTGSFITGSSPNVPSPYYPWPIWDTASKKIVKKNFYFGDYISNVNDRRRTRIFKNAEAAKPVMISEEDIINVYSDQDPSRNPEFRPGAGYPLGIDILEAIYTWSFGRYRDLVFVRYRVTNRSLDTLRDCWMAPIDDPDLAAAFPGGTIRDHNSYVDSTLSARVFMLDLHSLLNQPYASNPAKLNMGIQWRSVTGVPYGMLGLSIVESPVIDSEGEVVSIDSVVLLGNNLVLSPKLTTFRKWRQHYLPKSDSTRYNFISAQLKDADNNMEDDLGVVLGTGPFILGPAQSAEMTMALTFAWPSKTDYKKNFAALLQQTAFAHQFFGEIDSSGFGGTKGYFINHFSFDTTRVKSVEQIDQPRAINCFPNPVGASLNVEFTVSKASKISVDLINALGVSIWKRSDEHVMPGIYQCKVDLQELSSGSYTVRLFENGLMHEAHVLHVK
jgi:hypothetical protein